MYFIKYLSVLVIATIGKGDEGPTADELEGLLYDQALIGSTEINRRTTCIVNNITREGSEYTLVKTYKYVQGDEELAFRGRYAANVTLKPRAVFSFYPLNEDGSRGDKVCEIRFQRRGSHGHVDLYSTPTRCNLGPGISYTSVCISPLQILDNEDIDDLKNLCPKFVSVWINQQDCNS